MPAQNRAGQFDVRQMQPSIESLLREKRIAEGRMLDGDDSVLTRYFEILRQIDRRCVGIVDFRWKGTASPLYFRCGSTDLLNFAQIFIHTEYAFDLRWQPTRILDLGAYIGYAAVYFANRFPSASLICVEPSSDSFRMLTLNTSAYRNIRCVNAAIWSSTGEIKFARNSPGDWGMHVDQNDADGIVVKAISLRDVLKLADWSGADFLKCDIEGAERELFGHDRQLIGEMVDCCAIELHESVSPGCEAAVGACFDGATFGSFGSGEYRVYMRHSKIERARTAPIVHVLGATSGIREIVLNNVPTEQWGYYAFDGLSCQLNATSFANPPAELTTEIDFDGQSIFETDVSVENPSGYGVVFGFQINEMANARQVKAGEVALAAGQRLHWTLPMETLQGRYRVKLWTRMQEGTPSNHQVRSFWLTPRFRGPSGGATGPIVGSRLTPTTSDLLTDVP